MARPLRIEYPGALYHVMNRGAGRRVVFPNDACREAFLQGLAEAHLRFGARIHAWCLMGNHYHLLLSTPRGNLSRIMRHVDGLYTQRHNRLRGTDGPLFRGRYKAVLIDGPAYLLQVSRYIHRNPIETRTPLVRRLSDYRWSSYRAYLGKERAPAWLDCEPVFGELAAGGKRRAAYRVFVEAGNNAEIEAFYAKARLAPVLGDKAFREKALRRAQAASAEVPRRASEKPVPASRIIAAVAHYYEVSPASLRKATRGRGARNIPRAMAMKLCQEAGGARLAEIADAFGVGHYSTVSQTIARLGTWMEEDRRLARDYNVLSQDLTPYKLAAATWGIVAPVTAA